MGFFRFFCADCTIPGCNPTKAHLPPIVGVDDLMAGVQEAMLIVQRMQLGLKVPQVAGSAGRFFIIIAHTQCSGRYSDMLTVTAIQACSPLAVQIESQRTSVAISRKRCNCGTCGAVNDCRNDYVETTAITTALRMQSNAEVLAVRQTAAPVAQVAGVHKAPLSAAVRMAPPIALSAPKWRLFEHDGKGCKMNIHSRD